MIFIFLSGMAIGIWVSTDISQVRPWSLVRRQPVGQQITILNFQETHILVDFSCIPWWIYWTNYNVKFLLVRLWVKTGHFGWIHRNLRVQSPFLLVEFPFSWGSSPVTCFDWQEIIFDLLKYGKMSNCCWLNRFCVVKCLIFVRWIPTFYIL